MTEASRAAEAAARESYGRLLAYLSARTHDIALAEDALAEAFAKALVHWPKSGVPLNPDAWILTTARNKITDRQRHLTRFPTEAEIPDPPDHPTTRAVIPDQRLSLLMVCAHPAIAADMHVPLMLQTVLGLDAKTIAKLFLISSTALTKRLSRAKAKIRDAGVPFRIPEDTALPGRSQAIFEAIYALHAHDWMDPKDQLGEEALYLADLLCKLLPDNAEALGLSALIAFSQSRAKARRNGGLLIPTEDQDTALWDTHLIQYGRRQMAHATKLQTPGRFQTEAAIEAVHVTRLFSGETDWAALNQLYFALQKIAPSAGGAVAQAVVLGRLHGPHDGLKALEDLSTELGPNFQPFWAAQADMYARLNNIDKAVACYERAIALATDTAAIGFLTRKLSVALSQKATH